MKARTHLESIRDALRTALETDTRTMILGEDIEDPYGGAFKATSGLSTKFPGRVISTPICENAIVGTACGMAMRGLRPIAEIMFGDFITLATDQIVNSATKFPLMYRGQVEVPLIIRVPMGGGRGYGPTHSQSLEKMFLGVPGLRVVAPSIFHDPGQLLLENFRHTQAPILFVESKLLYPRPLFQADDGLSLTTLDSLGHSPTAIIRNYSSDKPSDALLITYGGMSDAAMQVLKECAADEIRITAIIPSLLSDPAIFAGWIKLTRPEAPIIIVEEGTHGFNWGAEVAAQLHSACPANSRLRITRLSTADDIIPASRELEKLAIPGAVQIKSAIIEELSK